MNIAYICLFVSDFEESIRFYRDILGLKEDMSRSTENFRALKAGSTYIGIEKNGWRKGSEKLKSENPYNIQFAAKSLDELKRFTEHLEKNGVRILQKLVETHYGTFTNFLDPDGNKLEMLYQPR